MSDYLHYGKELHETADLSVLTFTKLILERIEKIKSEMLNETTINTVYHVDSTEKYYASGITIRNKFGAVMILPDFSGKGGSEAFILNLGKIRAMLLEGFSQEYITNEGEIYSDGFAPNEESIKALGYYLTRYLDTAIKNSSTENPE